jgi:serine protease Do
MVSLQVTTGHGVTQDCGVAVAPGGFVVTTLDAVADARTITAFTASGEHAPAIVVATDRGSDIALVRVADDLPVAKFAGDTFIDAGHQAMVVAMASRSGRDATTSTMWSDATIRSVGTAVRRGDASGMAGIDAAARSMPDIAGEPLLQPDGRVLGILDSTGSPPGVQGTKVFLPAQLVVGVADALAAGGQVQHGWLDVEGEDAPTRSLPTTSTSTAGASSVPASTTTTAVVGRATRGALVLKVAPNGASAHVLRAGDVILGVDGAPVRSMAELRSRLYVLKPGTRVKLEISRGGATATVAVDLSASP